MSSSSHKLKLYQAILAFLQEKKGSYILNFKAVLSLAEQEKIAWPLNNTSLEKLYSAAQGNLSFIADAEKFIAVAFKDLFEMRNPVAHDVFESLRFLCGVNSPAFVLCVAKVKRCKKGKGGIVIIRSSDVSLFLKYLSDSSGRGTPLGGKLMN